MQSSAVKKKMQKLFLLCPTFLEVVCGTATDNESREAYQACAAKEIWAKKNHSQRCFKKRKKYPFPRSAARELHDNKVLYSCAIWATKQEGSSWDARAWRLCYCSPLMRQRQKNKRGHHHGSLLLEQRNQKKEKEIWRREARRRRIGRMDLKTNKQLPATEYETIGEARGGTSQRRLHGKGNQNAKFQESLLVDYRPGDSQTLRAENFTYIRRCRSTPPLLPCVRKKEIPQMASRNCQKLQGKWWSLTDGASFRLPHSTPQPSNCSDAPPSLMCLRLLSWVPQ